MVIVSGGALGSPAILERSGVGDPNVLERERIRTLANLTVQETLDGFVNGNFDVPTLIETNDKILR
jgi:alcohol oxidase